MSQAVRFQDPGEGIHDAEVVEVAVSEGDRVEQGQVVLVVETDKADFEVESSHAGKVGKVHVRVGDRIEVGRRILSLDAEGAEKSRDRGDDRTDEPEREGGDDHPREREEEDGEERAREQEEEEGEERAHEREEEDEGEDRARERDEDGEEDRTREAEGGDEADRDRRDRERSDRRADGGPVPASPATRRLARSLGVDLAEVEGSGEQGRVLAQDVRAHADGRSRDERRPERPLPDFSRWGPVDRAPLRSVRRTIARRLARAWRSIPHVHHADLADVTELDGLRRRQSERLEREQGDPLSWTVLVLKATAAVLRELPRFNASLDPEQEEIIYKRYLHLGVAMDTPRGLLVPSIRDVDRKSVREIAHELGELAERARGGALEREEMMRGTFTITNVGAIGGTSVAPIINEPEVAILGLGRVGWEPRVRGEGEDAEIVPRLVLPLCLAFDHRVNDGADAARFMNRLIGILSDPEWFALTI